MLNNRLSPLIYKNYNKYKTDKKIAYIQITDHYQCNVTHYNYLANTLLN